MVHDVIIIGGSYAGMAAGLQLARARRNVLVVDGGQRRNRFAAHAHGFLGQDGRDPSAIAADGRTQLLAYPSVSWREGHVSSVAAGEEGFVATLADGERVEGRRLVLAMGVTDTLPPIEGLAERWGRAVFHCPYCHGYELDRGELAVLATGRTALHQAMLIPEWGATTLLLNDALVLAPEERDELDWRGVTVIEGPVQAIRGHADVVLEDGRMLSFAGIFTASRTAPSSPFAEALGCAMEEGPLGPFIRTDQMQQTSVRHVFACGDAARGAGSLALAVGDGTMAGAATHRSLIFPG
ncbi:NAD(P)/FAD-dependent oxidoreductase [Arsenicitalea aurantiaca]|uniref:Thioredoxin reductase n=1 Tax=Arsenicitalea aurantiaca TaxID=1783274 RepID=A0A433XKF2_9HYPH|nr:NAD(P)/FAD-dependent oxidoreductase [Arsenicitalea aurantiaca]RUT34494.1 NAD(P)/FAD-dependent oxidoreductase [Arsenicitalea aurantiaca]